MQLLLSVATILEYGVLVLLFLLSIWSISIMIDRRRALWRERGDADVQALRHVIKTGELIKVKSWTSAHPGIHAATLSAAIDAVGSSSNAAAVASGQLDRAVRSYLVDERLRLEKGLPVLATLGANTPFIGLFGTVLGIIRSFAALGESSGAASSVMSGISQALLATAAGLFVAIPAVVAFNAYSNRLRQLLAQCESLKDLYVTVFASPAAAKGS